MAGGDVRIEENLKVKIGEAKKLHSSTNGKGIYCTVALDQEQIFKTVLVENNLNPFFGEEFKCQIPRKFRFLKFYLYEKGLKQDKVTGTVGLHKEELHKYHGKDHWFPITEVNANSEVQGKVHIEIRFNEFLTIDSSVNTGTSQRMAVKIVECSDLTVTNGACNPYAAVTLLYGKGCSRVESKRTAVKKKTICPHYDETFFFEIENNGHDRKFYSVDDLSTAELSISLWHDDSRVSLEVLGSIFHGAFLGEVKIPICDLNTNKTHTAWYFLQPKESSVVKKPDLGSLRLKISYTSDHVFSSLYYDGLRKLLLESPYVQPITSSAAYILGEVVEFRQEAADPLVCVFLSNNSLVPFFESLADVEISRALDPNTIFRGNTLITKCIDSLMKLVGMHYLHDLFKSIIDEVCMDNKPCEIDPTRLKESDSLDTNMQTLVYYVEKVFNAIVVSSLSCPTAMCEVFFTLKEVAQRHFPDNREIKYQVVSGFIFLRFFAPAILGPKLFHLTEEALDPVVTRKLTLISKAIQSLGNLVSAKVPSFGFKEEYMVPLFRKFTDNEHVESVRIFLEIISSASRAHSNSIEMPIVLKEGILTKRAQGRKKFGMKNFKQRYFCLTNQNLRYSRSVNDSPLCEIPAEDILAVEALNEASFKMKNMFQVIQPDRTLYIQASNCVEEKEWMDILNKVCKTNENRLNEYHPAAYLNGNYCCCQATDVSAKGCSPVTGGLPSDLKLHICSDREIERIHSLFVKNMEKLEKIQETCANMEVYTGEDASTLPSSFIIDDTKTCFETISDILKCVISLEQEHHHYNKMVQRNTVPGSQDAPLGNETLYSTKL